jgi:ribosomal protein S18 acetylase RimI-like enzyme
MEPLSYRTANEGDLDFIIRLSMKLFSKYGSYDEIVPGWFSEAGVITVVVTEKTDPLGFAMLAIERRGERPRGHLLAIGVFPEHQRKGIGSALLGHMVDLARKYGLSEVYLWTANDNLQALSLFQKGGFKIIGSEKDYYPRGQPALAMYKRIDP